MIWIRYLRVAVLLPERVAADVLLPERVAVEDVLEERVADEDELVRDGAVAVVEPRLTVV